MSKLVRKIETNESTATLFFEGEINSSTAPEAEKELTEALQGLSFQKLVLDIEGVTYLSSAGLRVILKAKQAYKNVSIINASLAVYDILSMTGFTNILEVKKALNKVDITGCEVIGEGYTAVVYRLDKDTIVKVYRFANDVKDVERELNMAKRAFVLGIPTAISFDIVRVGDKLGVRFEMLDSKMLRDLFLAKPDSFDEYITKYANLLQTINSTEPNDPSLPSTNEEWVKKVEALEPYLDKALYQKLLGMVQAIPQRETFVHGDCHIKNILVQDDELYLIDMDTLSRGHPIFELASLCAPYLLFEEDVPGNNEAFFGISVALSEKIYYGMLERYLGRDDKVAQGKIRLLAYIHMAWWFLTYDPKSKGRLERGIKRLKDFAPNYDDFEVGI